VNAALQRQLERTAAALHAALPDSAAAAELSSRNQADPRPSGLGYLGRAGAAAAAAASSAAPLPAEPPAQPLGFRLEAGPSGIQHAAAGLGVWLRGRASLGQVRSGVALRQAELAAAWAGGRMHLQLQIPNSKYLPNFIMLQVVALYPGVVYRPLFHRSIPGYPMVATDNEFLLSRLDGAALDGKPWGLGSLGAEPWPPFPPRNRAEELLSRLEVGGWCCRLGMSCMHELLGAADPSFNHHLNSLQISWRWGTSSTTRRRERGQTCWWRHLTGRRQVCLRWQCCAPLMTRCACALLMTRCVQRESPPNSHASSVPLSLPLLRPHFTM
jgi:hypothetical protein